MSCFQKLQWLAALLGGLQSAALANPSADFSIFDEDDPAGVLYYDASVASFQWPGSLQLAGPGHDKIRIHTGHAYQGEQSGILSWKSAAGGKWKVYLASPGFQTRDLAPYGELHFVLNAPEAIAAGALPRVALENSLDVSSRYVLLKEYLREGIDGDPESWQTVRIPLSHFAWENTGNPRTFKTVCFSQNSAEGISRVLWIDSLKLAAPQKDAGGARTAGRLPAPVRVIQRTGDRAVVLHWEDPVGFGANRFKILRSTQPQGPFEFLPATATPLQSYADLAVQNGQTYYRICALSAGGEISKPSETIAATPAPFASDDDFLEFVQKCAFDFFWYEANPRNGLVRDRSQPFSACNIAGVGFGLTAIGTAVDRQWLDREAARERTYRTLKTFWELPQGKEPQKCIGYKGWFYHFLEVGTGFRAGTSELSSIDTALLLAGIIYAREFYDQDNVAERQIRELADKILRRVDWTWMLQGENTLSHGWRPESGFLANRWTGYNEAMILYIIGLGAPSDPLPADCWNRWTSDYQWQTNFNYSFVGFPPLFGHQYSHCWIDFREITDSYMRLKGITYFENSRRATLAQRSYAIHNPDKIAGYGQNVWGWTACDGPGIPGFHAYIARGAAPATYDDGTVAPTAAGGSLPFTPEHSMPALRHLYDQYREQIWTGYGFRDAFNLKADWWNPDVIGIDQGPIILMAENYRTQRIWQRFMRHEGIQRGLRRAGFRPLEIVKHAVTTNAPAGEIILSWEAVPGVSYQLETSPNAKDWHFFSGGSICATGSVMNITHKLPALSSSLPYYRILNFGEPRAVATSFSSEPSAGGD